MAITPPTATDVKAINGSTFDDAAIAPFISAAECIINQVEACMIGKGISDACQTSSAAWLSAHLMASAGVDDSSRVKKRETFENYTVEWAQSTVTGQGLLSSTFGATANAMAGGCLQETDKRQVQIFGFGGA